MRGDRPALGLAGMLLASGALSIACTDAAVVRVELPALRADDPTRTLLVAQSARAHLTMAVVDPRTGEGLDALAPLSGPVEALDVEWTAWRFDTDAEHLGGLGPKREGTAADRGLPVEPRSSETRALRREVLGPWSADAPTRAPPRSPDFPPLACGLDVSVRAWAFGDDTRAARWIAALVPLDDDRIVAFVESDVRAARGVWTLDAASTPPTATRRAEFDDALDAGVVRAAAKRGDTLWFVTERAPTEPVTLWRGALGPRPSAVTPTGPDREASPSMLRRVDGLRVDAAGLVLGLSRNRFAWTVDPDAREPNARLVARALIVAEASCEVYVPNTPRPTGFQRPCTWFEPLEPEGQLFGWSDATSFTWLRGAQTSQLFVPPETASGLTPPVRADGRLYGAGMTRPPSGLWAFDDVRPGFLHVVPLARPLVEEPVLVGAIDRVLLVFGRDGTIGPWRLDDARACPLARSALAPMTEPLVAVPWRGELVVGGLAEDGATPLSTVALR